MGELLWAFAAVSNTRTIKSGGRIFINASFNLIQSVRQTPSSVMQFTTEGNATPSAGPWRTGQFGLTDGSDCALAPFFSSSPTVRPGNPATSKYRTESTSYCNSTVLSPFIAGERRVCALTVGMDPLGSASLTMRPNNRPLLGMDKPSTCAMVRPTSALLVGASSTNVVLKS